MIELICAQANRIFNGDCFSKSRKRENVNARIAISVILRDKKFYTLQTIASLFDLNHEMVLYYQKKHDELIKFNREYRILYDSLINYSKEKTPLKHGFCNHSKFELRTISL